MGETMTDSKLALLFLRRGTTAAEVAAMDVGSLTRLVEMRRPKVVPHGAVSPGMTDEQIARAILAYARSYPRDWPVTPRATTGKRACGPGLLGALGGGVGGLVFEGIGVIVVGAAWEFGDQVFILAGTAFWVALAGAILGAPAALAVTGRTKRATLPVATGLAVSFILAAAFWLWFANKSGAFDQVSHKSAGALLERYQAGKLSFSDWDLSDEDLSGATLSEADLHGANLSGANLSGTDLSGADLSGAHLSGADLYRANLEGADLTGADLDGTNLTGAQLTEAHLSGANLSEANLSGTDLNGAYLSGAYLIKVDLSKLDLSGFNLSGTTLAGADLRGVNLSGADLSGANLYGANLSGANLTDANLGEANLTDAILTEAQLSQAASLERATMPDGSVHE